MIRSLCSCQRCQQMHLAHALNYLLRRCSKYYPNVFLSGTMGSTEHGIMQISCPGTKILEVFTSASTSGFIEIMCLAVVWNKLARPDTVSSSST
mmetsp:Transcript_7979/g.12659  ORF Transcript_7979/g.12659 Transcript_7979/m.12659 type:complete len:94 (+) Transcript_7979:151-432(+)